MYMTQPILCMVTVISTQETVTMRVTVLGLCVCLSVSYAIPELSTFTVHVHSAYMHVHNTNDGTSTVIHTQNKKISTAVQNVIYVIA